MNSLVLKQLARPKIIPNCQFLKLFSGTCGCRQFSLNKPVIPVKSISSEQWRDRYLKLTNISGIGVNSIQTRFISEDNETKALTIWQDMKHLRYSPKPALVLGFSGLLPFIGAPFYLIMNQTYFHDIAFAQLMYGATILSFLGGVRWGYVINKEHLLNWFNMGYSVTPPLIAWIGLLFPFPLGVVTMISGLALSAYFDTMLRGYPPWFKALRFTLSFFAVLSLWTTFMCKYLLKESDDKTEVKAKKL